MRSLFCYSGLIMVLSTMFVYANTCRGIKTCQGPPEERISVSLKAPTNGSCECTIGPDYVECITYKMDGDFHDREIEYCHGMVGTGNPDGGCGALTPIFWIVCSIPFAV